MVLKQFLLNNGLPQNEADIVATLKSERIKEIRNFVLGPGLISNIPQACQLWLARTGLEQKATIISGRVPDEYMAAAQTVTEPGVVPLYWTCAVFGREKDLFFGHGVNTLMFYVQQVMPLDSMQLAAKPEKVNTASIAAISQNLELPKDWRKLTSHKSPAPLLHDLIAANPHINWLEANSNGEAAMMCYEGRADAGIVTETARAAYGLTRIHNFGCPDMVFFGGLTEHGARILAEVFCEICDPALVE